MNFPDLKALTSFNYLKDRSTLSGRIHWFATSENFTCVLVFWLLRIRSLYKVRGKCKNGLASTNFASLVNTFFISFQDTSIENLMKVGQRGEMVTANNLKSIYLH